MQTLGVRQQPVQTDNLQPILICQLPDLSAFFARDGLNIFFDRKRSDLQPLVPGLGGMGQGLFPRKIPVDFIADCVLHVPTTRFKQLRIPTRCE